MRVRRKKRRKKEEKNKSFLVSVIQAKYDTGKAIP